jgi:hypothetical protein
MTYGRDTTRRAAPDAPRGRPCRVVPSSIQVPDGAEPISRPLPHVAGHVVVAETIGCERVHRCGAEVAVGQRVVAGKLALPHIHPVLAVGPQRVAPGKARAFETAARGVLPLRLGGQAQARPSAVGKGVVPGNMDDRMICPGVEGRTAALGALPAGAGHLPPPLRPTTARVGGKSSGRRPAKTNDAP